MSRQHATAAACQSTVSHRREVLRLSNERFLLRGRSTVLLEHGDGSPADKKGYRSTHLRVGETEGNRADSTRQVPGHCGDADVQQYIQPLQSGSSVLVPGMLSLSIRKRVRFADRDDDVYELNDWPVDDYRNARRGPWMHYAADRHRFKRRIQQTEDILSKVLTDSHRDKIKSGLSID